MSAVAPLAEHELVPEHGIRVRPRDLRRTPLQRRPVARGGRTIARPSGSHTTTLARPHLVEVEAPRHRGTMSLVVVGGMILFAMLIGTVAFQTQIARNQLALDKTEKDVAAARDRYDVLRRQRAQLRSPNRLAVEAARLGMVPAPNGEFMTITPDVVASVAAAASALPADVGAPALTSLDQFGQIKAATGDVP